METHLFVESFTCQIHGMITRDALREGCKFFDHGAFFNVHLNLNTRASSISPPLKCSCHCWYSIPITFWWRCFQRNTTMVTFVIVLFKIHCRSCWSSPPNWIDWIKGMPPVGCTQADHELGCKGPYGMGKFWDEGNAEQNINNNKGSKIG